MRSKNPVSNGKQSYNYIVSDKKHVQNPNITNTNRLKNLAVRKKYRSILQQCFAMFEITLDKNLSDQSVDNLFTYLLDNKISSKLFYYYVMDYSNTYKHKKIKLKSFIKDVMDTLTYNGIQDHDYDLDIDIEYED